MRNILSQKIQNFFVIHPAFLTMLLVILLLVLMLCVLGQWSLLLTLSGMTIFFSINVLIFSTMYQTYRNAGSNDYYHPFSCVLNSLIDPLSRSEQELIERQEEDFKPFVFKDHPEDSEHE